MNIKTIFDKLASDNKKIMLIMVLFLAVLYFDFSAFLKPQIQAYKIAGGKALSTRNQIKKLKQDLAASQDIKRKAEQQGMKSVKAKKIISDQEIPSFLKEISDLANKNQVRVNQIKPVREIKDAKSAKTDKFDVESISLELNSDYHRLGAFINDLENCIVFVWVEEFKINSDPKDFFRQDIKLVLKTYVKK